MEIIKGKYSQNVEEIIPCILLNTNFLIEYRRYSYAGWEQFLTEIFSNPIFWHSVATVSSKEVNW
jgi:hypothetical protein